MVDLTDTRAFFKEHWRPILIISLVVIAVIVGISLALVFTLKRTPIPTTVGPPAQYPPDLNGDPPQGSNIFAFPQIITNPLPGTNYFGQRLYVHDAGFIATTVQRTATYQSVLFYYTNLQGEIQGPQEIALNFLPSGFVVCNGMFAPIFNVAGEIFYLFLSVGTQSVSNGNVYPQYVLLFTLDTSQTSNVWSVGSITTEYYKEFTYPVNSQSTIKLLKLPSDTFQYNAGPNANRPWYGTFGNKIQVVMDDNAAVTKQSLYVSGSEYDTDRPGGNLYWYILQDNSASPSILLTLTIQDAKLLMMQNQGTCPTGCSTGCATFDRYDESNCTNGFASDFFVTSGNKTSNILVVANSTCQDNCVLTGSNQPCAPKGYVQGYVLDTIGGTQTWVQLQAGTGTFQYRYIGTASDPNILNPTTPGGFASSVSVSQNKLLIGQAEPNASGNGIFLAYNWTPSPYQNGQLTLLSTLNPTTGASNPFEQSNLLTPTSFIRYNIGVQTIPDGSNQILATTWYQPGPADVISVQDPEVSGQPFTTFATLQSLGAGFSSNSTASPVNSRTGFAQNTQMWLSRTGASVRLATNDPFRSSNSGRFIVFTRKRQ